MPTGLMLTCETSKCKIEICNLFFNPKDCGTTMLMNFAVLVCSKDKNFVY